ncbi:MAG: SusD/RagB family nutrient-binding outer membrane lipoprotein [Chitinophagaceae bacterium]
MRKNSIIFSIAILTISLGSCKKYLDINKDPDNILATQAPLDLLLTNATVNTGFDGGSDLFRYAALLSQQLSGQTTGGETQTQAYEKYNIQSADVNNQWISTYSNTLNDLETIIQQAGALQAPHYSGVAKLLKAFNYQILVDSWGDIPFSEALKNTENLFPAYDNDEDVYKGIIKLIDEGIVEINSTTSSLSPGTNSTIYPGSFSTKKANWIKFANTLKLRIYIHYSKFDKAFMLSQISALVGNPATTFFASNADNFEMSFFNETERQNPIHQFQIRREDYLFANAFMVNLMNSNADPRRATYFTEFPAGSGNYAGALSGDPSSRKYSRMHTFLRGATTSVGAPSGDGSFTESAIKYTGDAPIRLLTYAEYNFIRAEAAVYGAPGDAEAFFREGITASMKSAGVSDANIALYLATKGTLTGTELEKVKRIIEEKYIANYGVMLEPWTDWRRTGFPEITKVGNAVTTDIPRSLPYPQSEIDLNPKSPGQKPNLLVRVFWDK